MSGSKQPTVAHFDGAPQNKADDSQDWIVRAANFVVRLTRCTAGARIVQNNCVDEFFTHVVSGSLQVQSDGDVETIGSDMLAIVPPGPSDIIARKDSLFVSVFTAREAELTDKASNAARYAEETGAAPLVSWPMPVDGYKIRLYNLPDYNRRDTLMRLFRTRSLMVNMFRHRDGPRDIHTLSPHSHADFEQGSLSLQGEWSHHLRYPWTADMSSWTPDEEIRVGSPALVIIPPTVIHTSRNTSEGSSRLVDIFAGPRLDFSLRPALVCNHNEYPMPLDS